MLLVHGLEDTTVATENTTRLAAAIRQAGGNVRTIFYPDRGHVGVVLSLAFPFRWLGQRFATSRRSSANRKTGPDD